MRKHVYITLSTSVIYSRFSLPPLDKIVIKFSIKKRKLAVLILDYLGLLQPVGQPIIYFRNHMIDWKTVLPIQNKKKMKLQFNMK